MKSKGKKTLTSRQHLARISLNPTANSCTSVPVRVLQPFHIHLRLFASHLSIPVPRSVLRIFEEKAQLRYRCRERIENLHHEPQNRRRCGNTWNPTRERCGNIGMMAGSKEVPVRQRLSPKHVPVDERAVSSAFQLIRSVRR